jgi:transcriptional regulator GlxA family with amidase domain
MITFDNAQVLDVTGPLEVFAMANHYVGGEAEPKMDAYRIEILAEEEGPVTMSSGIKILADRSWKSDLSELDTLLVSGGPGAYANSKNRSLQRVLREQNSQVRRIASICTGSFILAEAGLLDGKWQQRIGLPAIGLHVIILRFRWSLIRYSFATVISSLQQASPRESILP